MHRLIVPFLMLTVAATGFAETTFKDVLFGGRETITLSGSGVSLPPGHAVVPLQDTAGHTISWRPAFSEIDENGFRRRHLFYNQVLHTPWGEVLIDGTEVGLHYDKDGVLRYADGVQVTSLTLSNTPHFTALDAAGRAIAALHRATPPPMRPGTFELDSGATMVIATVGKTSRVAFDVNVSDGRPYRVRIDAATAEILHVNPRYAHANCAPDTTTYNGATGYGLRYGISGGVYTTRSLAATSTTTSRGTGGIFTKEASFAWPGYTTVNVYQYGVDSNGQFSCSGRDYTLYPVPTVAGSQQYDDFGDGWRGKHAADAMYFTNETMAAFAAFGRNSWNGQGAVANITIRESSGTMGSFPYYRGTDSAYASKGVVMTPMNETIGWGWEAAIDIVAHEWGHGFLFTPGPYGPNMQSTTGDSGELHEGLADVIGHIVEKKRQSATSSGVEKSQDWRIGEDAFKNGSYVRAADVDDGTYNGNNDTGRMIMHRTEPRPQFPNAPSSNHEVGNMMGVAFRALADGLENPYCSGKDPNIVIGCNYTSAGIGIDAASRIFLFAITNYFSSTHTWATIANAVRAAAQELYYDCGASLNRNAEDKQLEVRAAFEQIGHPPTVVPAPRCN